MASVAPGISAMLPFNVPFCHWKVIGVRLHAVIQKLACWFTSTRARAGFVKITGAVAAGVTVNVPRVLVTLPAAFVTVTVKLAPLSAVMAAGMANEPEVAPVMIMPFFNHW